METSIFLARVLGLVCVFSALSVLVRYKELLTVEAEVVSNRAVSLLAGYAILIMGVLLVVSHWVWVPDWRLVITILSWMVLFKGLGRIFFPSWVQRMIARKKHNRAFMLGEIVLLLVGLYLLYWGFLGTS